MSVWTVALACAAIAGVLTCGVPTLVRRLPAPADAGESDAVAAGGSDSVSYAAIAAERWFLPVGVVVSVVGAGLLGAAMGADPLLVVLVPLAPLGYALAVIDARARLLPRRLVVPATLVVLAALVVEWAATGTSRCWYVPPPGSSSRGRASGCCGSSVRALGSATYDSPRWSAS